MLRKESSLKTNEKTVLRRMFGP